MRGTDRADLPLILFPICSAFGARPWYGSLRAAPARFSPQRLRVGATGRVARREARSISRYVGNRAQSSAIRAVARGRRAVRPRLPVHHPIIPPDRKPGLEFCGSAYLLCVTGRD